jgi:hypothetical protein
MDNIKSKIAKLMNMADPERGGSAQECETALRQAEAMMRKYGIDASEIKGASQAHRYNWESGFYAFGRDGKPTQSTPKWFGWLAVSIAHFTDTIVVQDRDAVMGFGVRFKGHDDDVVFALWLVAYLKSSIRRETRLADLGSSTARETFRKSMALGLCVRMKALRAERNQVFKQAGTALVVVDQKMAERDSHFGAPRYVAGRRVTLSDQGAAAKGFQAAQKVQFNKVVSQPSHGALQ